MTTTTEVHFVTRNRRKCLTGNEEPKQPSPQARVPRISKLMALAIRFDQLLRDGAVHDMSELARLAHVTQPRMTQMMNLLHLAPDIQEEILSMQAAPGGRDYVTERELRPLTKSLCWKEQRAEWLGKRNAEVLIRNFAPSCSQNFSTAAILSSSGPRLTVTILSNP